MGGKTEGAGRPATHVWLAVGLRFEELQHTLRECRALKDYEDTKRAQTFEAHRKELRSAEGKSASLEKDIELLRRHGKPLPNYIKDRLEELDDDLSFERGVHADASEKIDGLGRLTTIRYGAYQVRAEAIDKLAEEFGLSTGTIRQYLKRFATQRNKLDKRRVVFYGISRGSAWARAIEAIDTYKRDWLASGREQVLISLP
jgi:hypothetical protein